MRGDPCDNVVTNRKRHIAIKHEIASRKIIKGIPFSPVKNCLRLDYALPAARHTADIDVMHHGRQSGRGIEAFLDGGMFGHSEHDDDGILNPHRNGTDTINDETLTLAPNCNGGAYWNGTPHPDMLYGVGAMSLGYWLTGEAPLADVLERLNQTKKEPVQKANAENPLSEDAELDQNDDPGQT